MTVKHEMITSIQDIDPIEFIEDYLGIKLLIYQKEILRRMLSTNKIYIFTWPRKILGWWMSGEVMNNLMR